MTIEPTYRAVIAGQEVAMQHRSVVNGVETQVTSGGVTKVLLIIEENHSYAEMQSGMPYLAGLATTYSYATKYKATTHPSLPNYLAIASGDYYGISDDNGPSSHVLSGGTVFGQAFAAGLTAHYYGQSMVNGSPGSDTSLYAVKHNPWAYFPAEKAYCNANSTNDSTFTSDAAANKLANVTMLVPDLNHDAHDGTLAQADSYLQSVLPSVLNSTDFTSGKLAVVITADEDDSNGDNTVLTVVLHPSLSHKVVTTALNHYSLCRMLSQVTNSTPLRNGATAADMAAAFGITVGQ